MSQSNPIHIAILDLYEGSANVGMDCIMDILDDWSKKQSITIMTTVFDVRVKHALPDDTYDLYLSSGGPGSPIDTLTTAWDRAYCNWLDQMYAQKKPVLLICHSFQIACRHFELGKVCLRKSRQIGILPVHGLMNDDLFNGLQETFYSFESRTYQIIAPNDEEIKKKITIYKS